MAFVYGDITRRPDGRLLRVEAPLSRAQVLFDGAAQNSPSPLHHVCGAASASRLVAVGQGSDDWIYAVTDQGTSRKLVKTSPVSHAQRVSFDVETGMFFVVTCETPTTWRRWLLDPETLADQFDAEDPYWQPQPVPRDILPTGTSQGFRDLVGRQETFYDDHVSPAVLQGVAFFRYHQRTAPDGTEWTAGILHSDRVGLWNGSHGWHSPMTTPVQPRIAIGPDGQPVVAISTDAGAWFLVLADLSPGLDGPAQPEPQPHPDPEPDPEPEPEPVADFPLADLQRERARYAEATIGPNECVDILNRALWPHRNEWGLLKKETGNHGVRKEDGARCSVDYAVRLSDRMGGDVFSSAGSVDGKGPSTPQDWSAHEEFPADRIVRAVQPTDAPDPHPEPDPAPEPQPLPQPVDLGPVLAKLDVLSADVNRVTQASATFGHAISELAVEVTKLRQAIQALPAQQKAPEYTGHVAIPVLGSARVELRPKG
jgi:hypothetical protein